MSDLIGRQAAIDALDEIRYALWEIDVPSPTVPEYVEHHEQVQSVWKLVDKKQKELYVLPPAQQRWIPCSERLPENIRPVFVTWKNTESASYYQYIVGKHFTGTACYKNGKWYWYSSTTEDMLVEYGRYDSEEFDEAIECIAWMSLPEPYKAESEVER